MKLIPLRQNNTTQIAKQVPCPIYNRQELKTGIVHIGVGGFHRSHQAYYIHQLLEKYNTLEWGICGVGLREADRKMYKVLKKQDGLYTLIIQNPDGTTKCEVIGAMKEMLFAVDNSTLVIDKMAHPDTKIVSLTITEGGYNFNPQTGNFNFENTDIQQDLLHPEEPKTVFGYLTGGSIDYATFILAAWCYYSDKGINENNEPLEIIDEKKEELHQAAITTINNPLGFLRLQEIFGNLAKNKRFTNKYLEMIQLLYKGKGIKNLMNEMI